MCIKIIWFVLSSYIWLLCNKIFVILHNKLRFLAKRKRINKQEKLICNLSDEEKDILHIQELKQALNHGARPGKFIE